MYTPLSIGVQVENHITTHFIIVNEKRFRIAVQILKVNPYKIHITKSVVLYRGNRSRLSNFCPFFYFSVNQQ